MSAKLCQYMCELVGSEEVVKIRRFFLNVVNHVMNGHEKCAIIISGSKGEGLDMPGSDVDLMIVLRNLPVYTCDETDIPRTPTTLIAETENASPGFALLRVPIGGFYNDLTEPIEDKLFLSNAMFKLFCQRKILKSEIFNLHGPCLVPPVDDFDFAYCLKCDHWPTVANRWIQRPRTSGWPSPDLVSEIVEKGIIFVPIGSKFRSETDNPLEWRISFSEAEKLLVHSFNHTQILTYAMLKIFLKEILNGNKSKPILCSYHLKTILFWVMEEVGGAEWNSAYLIQCFKLCIKRLTYFIINQFCPHYFIPQNNLFEGRITSDIQQELLRSLQWVFDDVVNIFTQSESLCGFLTFTKPAISTDCQRFDYYADWGVFPLLFLAKHICAGKWTLKRLEELLRNRWSKVEKQIVAVVFAYFCNSTLEYFLQIVSHGLYTSNKAKYPIFNQAQATLLIGSNIGVTAWLKLAILYLCNNNMNRLSVITNYVLSELMKDKLYLSTSGNIDRCVKTLHGLQLSLIQRHKLAFVYDLRFFDNGTYTYCTDTNPDLNVMLTVIHLQKLIKKVISPNGYFIYLEQTEVLKEHSITQPTHIYGFHVGLLAYVLWVLSQIHGGQNWLDKVQRILLPNSPLFQVIRNCQMQSFSTAELPECSQFQTFVADMIGNMFEPEEYTDFRIMHFGKINV